MYILPDAEVFRYDCMEGKRQMNRRQKLFRELILGTLLYTVVLGFFNDYTDILHTSSYSVTFALAVVMEGLTFLTFLSKDRVIAWFKNRDTKASKYLMVFSVWLILFFSKFVFIEVIALIFRDVKISGFIGVLLMVACLTLAERLIYFIDQKLED